MLRLVAATALIAVLAGGAARADEAAKTASLQALVEALALPELVEVMREEGLVYGEGLEDELFPGRGGSRWEAAVDRIYDGGRIEAEMRAALDSRLDAAEIAPLVAFFTSPRGARIVALELSARKAMLDPEIDRASRERLEEMQADGDPKLDLVGRFIAVNGLIEANVAGALNANYAFYTGLVDGRAFDYPVTEDQILDDVRRQAPEIREDTRTWLFSYLTMAYAPLDAATMEAYIGLSESRPGRDLNDALFEGVEAVFEDISHELGLAAARFMAGQDL
ncbi:DUF2059 domain-containing protein [Rhodovulum sulfidophilum]|uniref:DUF2059 domain-containing protein n=1 Tax=Rhodovulum sulfidophilum TaxID=35806 RepID=UPI0013899C6E|nr:DUF2059 domain-containing protein [Rhodovulum sulfidophilum]NDK34821.1 DUF2059 domain-containing protein [Rhodovulum sulfidophilum]